MSRLQDYLKQDPDNRSLLQETVEVAMQCGELEQARELLNRALSGNPTEFSLRFQLGVLSLAERKFADAETVFEALWKQGQDHPAIRYNLAYAQLMAGRHAEARSVLQSYGDAEWAAVPDARKLMAHALHHLDAPAEAIPHLKTLLEQRSDDAEAWGLLAMVEYDSGRNDNVVEAAEHALKLRANEPNALLALGSLWLERQEPDRALEFFEPLIEQHVEHGRAWSGVAFARMLRMDLAGAMQAFEKAVRFMPNHIGTWHGLAWLQILNNDLAGAEASFNKAMAIDRNFGETHGGLAVLAVMRGQLAEAEPMIRRATGLDKASFAGRFARSLVLAKAGQKDASGELVGKILTGGPDGQGPGLRDAIAKVLARHTKAPGK